MSIIPYNDIDPELRELVKELNTVLGLVTKNSCFGHSGRFNHYFFITFQTNNKNKFIEFATNAINKTYYKRGKVYLHPDGHVSGFSVRFNQNLFADEYELTIHGFNDPSITQEGINEKIKAVEFLRRVIAEINDKKSFNVVNGNWYEL